MESKMGDIRQELQNWITTVQGEIGKLQAERGKIEEKLQEAEAALSSLRQVYELQAKRFGETTAPLFAKKGTSYRFAGMRLVDAIAVIRRENPGIDKRQTLKMLEKEGYDFRGKRPLPAVHFAWVALDRRKK